MFRLNFKFSPLHYFSVSDINMADPNLVEDCVDRLANELENDESKKDSEDGN